MKTNWLLFITVCLLAVASTPASAQQNNNPPTIPSEDDIYAGKIEEQMQFVPTNFGFHIGIVAENHKEIMTAGGAVSDVKTPLYLVNPNDPLDIAMYATNFPARIIDSSSNGEWIIGVAPSSSVERSSGSRQRECAVSLNMNSGEINIIEEFPLFSSFQALFSEQDKNLIHYCVNEPAAVNEIVSFNLKKNESKKLDTEGNRFYIHGKRTAEPYGLWITDPFSISPYPELVLLNTDDGSIISEVKFPGSNDVLVQPGGNAVLAIVEYGAETSLGYYNYTNGDFAQVPNLVLTRPTFKWAHNSMAVVAKESTSTRDRFLWIDLATGNARELLSGYFKISHWDIAVNDEALVFVVDSDQDPLLFVVSLDPMNPVVNRITLKGVSNVSWVGCLFPPQTGGWLQKLIRLDF